MDNNTSCYDAVHPDDTLLMAGPSQLFTAQTVFKDKPPIPAGMLSEIHLTPDAHQLSVSRPVLQGRTLSKALTGDNNPTFQCFGIMLLLRTKDRQIIRGYYLEECSMKAPSMSVRAGDSLVSEFAVVNFKRIRDVTRETFPHMASEFDPPPPKLLASSLVDIYKRIARKKPVLSPRERAWQKFHTSDHFGDGTHK